jgi:predicted TIM-barrel fold metal-dependent hydrolase
MLELLQALLSDLSAADRELIFSENAAQFYRLEDEMWSTEAEA